MKRQIRKSAWKAENPLWFIAGILLIIAIIKTLLNAISPRSNTRAD